jgi:hypothetical protein
MMVRINIYLLNGQNRAMRSYRQFDGCPPVEFRPLLYSKAKTIHMGYRAGGIPAPPPPRKMSAPLARAEIIFQNHIY